MELRGAADRNRAGGLQLNRLRLREGLPNHRLDPHVVQELDDLRHHALHTVLMGNAGGFGRDEWREHQQEQENKGLPGYQWEAPSPHEGRDEQGNWGPPQQPNKMWYQQWPNGRAPSADQPASSWEDIPNEAMSVGIDWAWETFPEYLDFLDAADVVKTSRELIIDPPSLKSLKSSSI